MKLEARLQRIEAIHAPGRHKMIVADSREDAHARLAEKKASGEIVDADTVVLMFFSTTDPEDPTDSAVHAEYVP